MDLFPSPALNFQCAGYYCSVPMTIISFCLIIYVNPESASERSSLVLVTLRAKSCNVYVFFFFLPDIQMCLIISIYLKGRFIFYFQVRIALVFFFFLDGVV